MPTQSEQAPSAECGTRSGEWAARTDTPKRSVFGNYRRHGAPATGLTHPGTNHHPAESEAGATLQAAIDLAVARSFIHRFLAKAFEDPTPEGWQWLCDPRTRDTLRTARSVAGLGDGPIAAFHAAGFQSFYDAYLAAFGHAARGSCPLNEIEYGDIKADPLFQPHRLADLAAFYRAFGLEVAEDAGERHDHICLELEFMCALAAKEAFALEHQLDAEQLGQCRDAQKTFLREHLGRWTSAFTRRLTAATEEPILRALAGFTRAFIESECARFGVRPGSEDLLLRPVDEAAESMCASCGLGHPPPGATAEV